MATIIEIQEDKLQNLSEYAEKVLRYGGKLMQCLDDLEKKSKYNEYYGHDKKRHEPQSEERYLSREERYPSRYY
jgi:hypothetical protein